MDKREASKHKKKQGIKIVVGKKNGRYHYFSRWFYTFIRRGWDISEESCAWLIVNCFVKWLINKLSNNHSLDCHQTSAY